VKANGPYAWHAMADGAAIQCVPAGRPAGQGLATSAHVRALFGNPLRICVRRFESCWGHCWGAFSYLAIRPLNWLYAGSPRPRVCSQMSGRIRRVSSSCGSSAVLQKSGRAATEGLSQRRYGSRTGGPVACLIAFVRGLAASSRPGTVQGHPPGSPSPQDHVTG
jgi:hypothetical protein